MSLTLYFSLLLVSMGGILAIRLGAHLVPVKFCMSILVSLVAIAWCFLARGDVEPPLRKAAGFRWYIAAVGLAFVTFVAATLVVEGLHRFLGIKKLEYTAGFLKEGYGWCLILVIFCVQPAVFEELAFRGVILGSLRRLLGTSDAVLVSSLLFMIIHLSVPSFPHLFLIGIVLGFLRVRVDSLYPGMLLHFTHNLLVMFSEVYGR